MPYITKFDRDALDDLRRLRKREKTTLLDNIQRYLVHQPAVERGTRIRALKQPAISQFRFRVGDFRVYYDVDDESQEVRILRVVEKGTRTTEEVTKDESD